MCLLTTIQLRAQYILCDAEIALDEGSGRSTSSCKRLDVFYNLTQDTEEGKDKDEELCLQVNTALDERSDGSTSGSGAGSQESSNGCSPTTNKTMMSPEKFYEIDLVY